MVPFGNNESKIKYAIIYHFKMKFGKEIIHTKVPFSFFPKIRIYEEICNFHLKTES